MSVYRYELTVPQSAIDRNDHVNNLEYIRWMLAAATAHADSAGATKAIEAMDVTWVVRSHHIDYLQPAFLDEHLIVFTWIAAVSRVRSTRKYKICRSGDQTPVAQGQTDWVLINTLTGRPITIPSSLANLFETVPESQEP